MAHALHSAHFTSFLPIIQECITARHKNFFHDLEWVKWRTCFEGGAAFRDEYLEKFTDREDPKDFERRRKLTPIPAFAKRSINAVKNAIAQRLPDVVRREGTKEWEAAVAGDGRGVDLRGSSMNGYLVRNILAELLVMGRVGVLVDAPKLDTVEGRTVSQADVGDFQPFLNRFVSEASPILIESQNDSRSDWSSVLLETQRHKFNLITKKNECIRSFRYYWTEETRGDLVNVVFLDDTGVVKSHIHETDMDQIPFVVYDIGVSLMADACPYQITMLNMLSADSNYAIDANYSFLVRQRGNDNIGSHLKGGKGSDTARTGATKGLYYGKNEAPPAFISPPTEPMTVSLELRNAMKAEIHELVTGSISGLGADGSIEAGLAFIGTVMQSAEQRIWDHWTRFEESREGKRKSTVVAYPLDWSQKTEQERNEETKALLELSAMMGGQKAKKGLVKMAIDSRYRGKISTPDIDAMKLEIDKAPYSTSDPKIIIPAVEKKIFSAETGALALGANAGEGTKAMDDAAKRAKVVVAAQAEAGRIAAEGQNARGDEDDTIDSQTLKEVKAGETEGDANLKDPKAPGRPKTNDE